MTDDRPTTSCDLFKAQLSAFVRDQLPEEQRLHMEEHFTGCLDCLDLWSAEMGSTPDLTLDILQQTSGDACADAQFLLGLGSELIQEDEAAMADAHRDGCGDCWEVSLTLEQLQPILKNMREVQPDPGFVDQVLAATLPSHKPLGRWRRFMGDLVKRPRFALELAYVASLLLFLIWKVADAPDPTGFIQSRSTSTFQSLARMGQDLNENISDISGTSMGGLTAAVQTAKEGCSDLVRKTSTQWNQPLQVPNPFKALGREDEHRTEHDTTGDEP